MNTTEKPWGYYTILYETEHSKTKLLCVKPHKSLSLQTHELRSEHWCVVQGIAEVFNGENIINIATGYYVYIPVGQKHQLINNTDFELLVIEVQHGICDENDIIRY